jgi:FixJ family two-component response regulator
VTADAADTADRTTRRQGRVVLLVEDDEGLRAALVRLLSAQLFETKAFASAEAALADRDLDWPDCLVIDLNLPALSGLDLVERLRQRGVTAPAVAITANDEARVRDEVRRRGVEHFLAKPFLGSALIALLEQIVGRQQPAGDGCR